MNISTLKISIATIIILFIASVIFSFHETKSLTPGDTINSQEIKAFGDGYAIAAGGCTTCLTLDPQLNLLKGRRTLIIFINEGKSLPESFSGCPTAGLSRGEFLRINAITGIPRIIKLNHGKIISMQRVDQTYKEYINEN